MSDKDEDRGTPNLISAILPVRNGEPHIAEQLAALSRQTYSNDWELIVVDNGCTDRTIEVVERWSDLLPSVRIIDARTQPGLNHARNAGAKAARGDLLVFCDADDVATPGWLAAMAQAAAHADVVGGRLDFDALNEPGVRAWRPQKPMTALLREQDWLAYAPGGNVGIWSFVAREIGWDEQFTFGSSDHDFSWRAQLAGYRLGFAPDGLMLQRYRVTVRATAAQAYRYGRSGARLYRAFRHHGMPAPDNRDALKRWWRLTRAIPGLWRSPERRGKWVRDVAFRAGRIEGSIRERVLYL